MTEHQKQINRAKKVAALMNSPVEGERAAATYKLQMLLKEYNLSPRDIGIKDSDFSCKANTADTKTNAKDLFASIIHSSTEVNETIMEIIYKHSYSAMPNWTKDMIMQLSRAYNIWVGMYHNSLRLFGYPSDLSAMKYALLNIRAFVEAMVLRCGSSDENFIDSYACGIVDQVIQGLGTTTGKSAAKMFKMYEYAKAQHGYITKPSMTVYHPVCTAYHAGLSDGYYFSGSL